MGDDFSYVAPRKKRGAQFVIVDMQGGPIPTRLIDEIEAAVQKAVRKYNGVAYQKVVE